MASGGSALAGAALSTIFGPGPASWKLWLTFAAGLTIVFYGALKVQLIGRDGPRE